MLMKSKIKAALLALSVGMIALNTGTCLFRLLGDLVGDQLWLGGIQ
jgi:hypothetical protein